jgi:hypothetical protein
MAVFFRPEMAIFRQRGAKMNMDKFIKVTIRRKSPKNPRATSLKLTKRSTTSMMALILMSQGGSRNS